jgi:hypothetical protein
VSAPSIEDVPDEDILNRWIEYPHMYNLDSESLTGPSVFKFPNGRPESVVWRKYVHTIADVHRLGFEKVEKHNQNHERDRQREYRGTIQATTGSIRAVNSRGHGFSVIHAPAEGAHHVQISYRVASGSQLKPGDKANLKEHLFNCFSRLIDPVASS